MKWIHIQSSTKSPGKEWTSSQSHTVPSMHIRHLIQGKAKVCLQLWVHRMQSLFLYCYLSIIVLLSIWIAVNLLCPTLYISCLFSNPLFSESPHFLPYKFSSIITQSCRIGINVLKCMMLRIWVIHSLILYLFSKCLSDTSRKHELW